MGGQQPTHQTESSVSSPSSEDFFIQTPQKIPQIVLTGGPACGKTTALNYLRIRRPDIDYLDEAATQVLASGFPLPSDQRPWTEQWQTGLQQAVVGHQLGLETIGIAYAKKGIIQDRGLLDGAAYLPGGVNELEELTRLSKGEMLARYHTVIYLGWLGSSNYEVESNPHRFEDVLRAKELSQTVRNSWDEHPRLIEITTRENRAHQVAQVIQNMLPEKQI